MSNSLTAVPPPRSLNVYPPAELPKQTAYPVEALPLIFREVVLEAHRHDGISIATLSTFAIFIAGIVTQGIVDITGPNGTKISPEISFIINVDSIDDKIKIVNRFTSSLKAIDESSDLEFTEVKVKYKAKLRIWKAGGRALNEKITKLKLQGECTEHLQPEIEEHERHEPSTPLPSRIIFDDIGGRTFMDALQGDAKIVGVIADESAKLLKNGLFRQLVVLNNALDGSTVRLSGAGNRDVVVRDARVSIIIMIPRSARDKYLSEVENDSRGKANLSHFLYADPPSTKAVHAWTDEVPTWQAISAFDERIKTLNAKRKRMVNEKKNIRQSIEYDDDALELLRDFAKDIEIRSKPGGSLHDINNFASKATDHVCEMAALFHTFTEQQGKLTRDTLDRAITIVSWHLIEASREFGTPPPVPQLIYDAEDLYAWMNRSYFSKNWRSIEKKQVRKNVTPICLRNDARLDAALALLVEQKRIMLTQGARRQCTIELRKGFN